jgi:hypothetical protein
MNTASTPEDPAGTACDSDATMRPMDPQVEPDPGTIHLASENRSAPPAGNDGVGPRRRAAKGPLRRRSGPVYVRAAEAAARLDVTETALRALCRRLARKMDGKVVASLGAGITAIKLGSSWRFRFADQ